MQELNERETVVKKVSIVPLEVIIRNISAGSFSKRYGVAEGIVFEEPTLEFSYKNDDLGDPLINRYHALALKLASREELEQLTGALNALAAEERGLCRKKEALEAELSAHKRLAQRDLDRRFTQAKEELDRAQADLDALRKEQARFGPIPTRRS